jgi:CubicO group peptidase (beta-lactamase class C family)
MRHERILALTLTLAALPAAAAAPTDDEIREGLGRHLAEAASERGFSGTVLFARGSDPVFHEAFGMADRDKGIANTTATLFDIGSISKQFTKAAVLVLQQQGKLSLTDPVSKHLEGVPADKAAITIEQVVDHAAGLHEYHDTEGDFEPMDRAEALRRILGQKLRFEPGSDKAYSNSGYTLLAAIVEQASGQGFQDFVREALLAPAGMERTGWYRNPGWKESRVAIGYDAREFGTINSPFHWPEITWAMLGNGGMVSNAQELLGWIAAVNDATILSAASRAQFYRLDADRAGAEPPRMTAYAGGNDFGFISVVVERLVDRSYLIVTTNADGETNAEREIRGLAAIAMPDLDFGPSRSADSGGEPPPPQGDWGLPGSPTGIRASELLDAIADGGAPAAERFVKEVFHPDWFEEHTLEDLVAVFRQVQKELRNPQLEGAKKKGPGQAELLVRSGDGSGAVRIRMEIEPAEPHRITGLSFEPAGG